MKAFNPLNFFLHPQSSKQRQYDALREYYLTNQTQKEIAEKHGYTLPSFQSLVRDFKNQRIIFFPHVKKGPKNKQITDETREKIIRLRKRNHSIYDIYKILEQEGFHWSISSIGNVLREEGFAKLPRRTNKELGITWHE